MGGRGVQRTVYKKGSNLGFILLRRLRDVNVFCPFNLQFSDKVSRDEPDIRPFSFISSDVKSVSDQISY